MIFFEKENDDGDEVEKKINKMDTDLNSKTVRELKELCREIGLATTGNENQLLIRLRNHHRDQDTPQRQRRQQTTNNDSDGSNNDSANKNDRNAKNRQQSRRVHAPTYSFKDIEESQEKFNGDSHKDVK